jgi:hypothetical protein
VGAITNSEIFERAARREISPQRAAQLMREADDDARKKKVAAARPAWVPSVAWAVASVMIVFMIDSLHRRS